jgi:uncharacterized protein
MWLTKAQGRTIMSPFPVTLATASLLALLFVILTVRVIQRRLGSKISMGTGDQSTIGMGQEESGSKLLIAARTHANFAEFVPLSLLLLGFIETSGGKHMVVISLAAVLILARLAHVIGLAKKSPNPFRVAGTALQMSMLALSGIYGLLLIQPNM